MMPVCLTIAGSDPSGGAGIQADLKVFHQHQVYGESVLTLLTVQNTCTVSAVKILEPDFIEAQLRVVLEDIPPLAAKTGALGNSEVIEMLAHNAADFKFPLVVDPVMISKHGLPLLDADSVTSLQTKLLPHAFLVTPNLLEASRIAEMEVGDLSSMEEAAKRIAALGAKNVLIKGGHLAGDSVDLLWSDGQVDTFRTARVATNNTHGTGCVFSAAITARLALGYQLRDAVEKAKAFVTGAITSNPRLGRGHGPINMHTEVLR